MGVCKVGRLSNTCRNSILMACYYLGIWVVLLIGRVTTKRNLFHPIRSTTQISVVTCHQYGVSAVITHTSFCGETSTGVIMKCWLFSQANLVMAI